MRQQESAYRWEICLSMVIRASFGSFASHNWHRHIRTELFSRWLFSRWDCKQSFALTPEGVELHFCKQRSRPGDLGSISITLPYENLQEILSDGMKYRLSEDYGKPPEEGPSDGLVQSGGRTLDPTKPMIALSSDDGPDSKVTPKLLDLLKQYNQRATFCVVGNRVESRSSVVKRAVEEGHEIGNHTWSHADTK